MFFILGFISGILLSIMVLISQIIFRKPIERKINQIESKLMPKGELFEAESDTLIKLKNNYDIV
jgi:hypothetical protein